MFNKLRDKLKSWTKGLSKKADTEEIQEEKIEEIVEETPKKEKKVKEKSKKLSKKDKQKEETEILEETLEIPPPKIEETETITELLETPKKFNAGTQSYEPDLEKIEEIEEKLSEIHEDIKNQKEATAQEETPKEKKSFFSKFTSKINKITFTEKDFLSYSEDLEMLLLENNVAFEVSEKIIEKLKEKLVGKEFLKKEIEDLVQDSLKEIIYEILIEPFDLIEEIKKFKDKEIEKKPYVILFCGINGTGKTTTIAKFADLLKRNKLSCVLAAGDTFRAASIEQLNKHGEKLNIKVISHEYGSDPASVGFDAIKYAEKNKIDVVLIDTAGRMHTEKNLMSQIEKVAKITKPNTKIFVGESITGNDIVEQVKAFNDSVKIDGIILSKADIDEKGGTALSVGYTTGKPILYLGTGQNYEDLERFDRNKFVEKLGL
jgi:fused signal recognition particle receptor